MNCKILLWWRISVNLEDGGHDGSLPIILTLAHVTYIDWMLTAMNKQDRSIPGKTDNILILISNFFYAAK